MTLLFVPGLGVGHREWGVVGAGVGTKVDEPPRERLEGRRLHREPAPHCSSFSTLALVTVMLGLLAGVRLRHIVGSESLRHTDRKLDLGIRI